MDLLEHLLWLYARYFATVVAGGVVLGVSGWLIYCVVGWCGRRLRPRR